MRTRALGFLAAALLSSVSAQTVLFDFDNLAAHSPLPISVTQSGITALLSGTGDGFSIQAANVMGFTPAGFSGNCIYPSSVFAADLRIGFSQNITAFAILYAPEEYACDSSATMRATAYSNGVAVATATTNAVAGTWPTEILRVGAPQGFDSVVVHYDASPITGGDWGPIFMADNMEVTPALIPIVLKDIATAPDGSVQFGFSNAPGRAFTILAADDLATAIGYWNVLGPAAEIAPGEYQFIDATAAFAAVRFYRVRAD
jgi:hypothetical protein